MRLMMPVIGIATVENQKSNFDVAAKFVVGRSNVSKP